MLTALPWQLQACVAEIVFSLFLGMYLVNSHPLGWRPNRFWSGVFTVWDATFLGLFVTGATHASFWYVVAAGYYLFGIFSGGRRTLKGSEPKLVSVEVERADGTVEDRTQAIRNAGNVFASLVYMSLLLMVVLG